MESINDEGEEIFLQSEDIEMKQLTLQTDKWLWENQ